MHKRVCVCVCVCVRARVRACGFLRVFSLNKETKTLLCQGEAFFSRYSNATLSAMEISEEEYIDKHEEISKNSERKRVEKQKTKWTCINQNHKNLHDYTTTYIINIYNISQESNVSVFYKVYLEIWTSDQI